MPSGSDYGRDFEIEVFREQKTTGITFSVQLKSSESPAANGSTKKTSAVTHRARAASTRH